MNTPIGENMRYCMHKFKITQQDWLQPITVIYRKIDQYIDKYYDCNVESIATAVRELCESRDMCNNQFFERPQLDLVIGMLCTQ